MESSQQKQPLCCSCEGNCLCKECKCFMQGKYCGPDCKCPNCHNKPEFEAERVEVIRKILEENPLAFTPDDSLNQDEFTGITNFAMLTNSVNTEPFNLQKQEKLISKFLIPRVLELSVVTILSAANEALDKSKDPKSFEEEVENSIASEFQDILKQVQNSIEQ